MNHKIQEGDRVCLLSSAAAVTLIALFNFSLLPRGVACVCCVQVFRGLFLCSSGLQSGDNTLNVLCSLRAAQSLVSGRFTDVSTPDARAAVLSDYVHFLTEPGSHRDTYAESFHRSFFVDWQDSRPTLPHEVKQTHPGAPVASRLHFCFNCFYSPRFSGSDVCRKTLQAEVELRVRRQPAGRDRLPSHGPPLHPAVSLSQWGASCEWSPVVWRPSFVVGWKEMFGTECLKS